MKHSVREVELKNGAKGILIHVPGAEVMSCDINFRAGDFLCPPDKWETAHLLEHLALGANQQYRSSRKFQAVFEQNGAYFNASTGPYEIVYETECADLEWERILDLLLVAIGQPLFLNKEFESELKTVKEELIFRGNNHWRCLALNLYRAYGLIARTDQERVKLLPNVTLKDIRTHYEKTHYTRNMRFVVAGNLTPEREQQIIKKLERVQLPEGKQRIELPDELPRALAKPVYVVNKSVPNIYFDFDTYKLNCQLAESEKHALSLINHVLTGTLHSRILGRAREKGLTYHVSSNWSWSKNYVGWGIGAQVSRESAPELLELINREVRRVLNGKLDLADLRASKDYAIGRYQRSSQTVSSIASKYSGYYFGTDKISRYDEFPEAVRAVTRARAIASFQKMFEDGVWGLGLLGTATKEERDTLQIKLKNIWNS